MPPDELRIAQTREWLAKASSDLRAAEATARTSPPLFEHAVFHCQQAVEKALKALLVFHDQPFRKTHSLEELGRLCVAIDASLGDLVDRVTYMSAYAWMYRYPGPVVSLDQADVNIAIADSTTALVVILTHLRKFTSAFGPDSGVDG